MEASQQLGKALRAKGNDKRQADGRIYRVAATYPIPETKGIFWIDTKLSNQFKIG